MVKLENISEENQGRKKKEVIKRIRKKKKIKRRKKWGMKKSSARNLPLVISAGARAPGPKNPTSPYFDRLGRRSRGYQFGGLCSIPAEAKLNPSPHKCFVCWITGH